jgi:hypothetical protein
MPNYKKYLIIFTHSLTGWILCAAIMGIGMSSFKLNTALTIHLILAPIIFFSISIFYFKKFNLTSPLSTALIFVSFVICMDFFIVALLIQKSLNMFKSLTGTWIPFLMIFLSALIAGRFRKSA